MMVALDEVVGHAQDGGTELAVAAAAATAVGFVYLVALVTGRSQAGTARDAPGIGVVLDRSHRAGDVGGGDDVGGREGKEQGGGCGRPGGGAVRPRGRDFRE